MSLQLASIGGAYLVLVLVGQIYFKKSAESLITDSATGFAQSLFLNWQLWVAGVTYFTAMLTWVWLLKHVDLSRIFPIMSALLLLTIPLVSAYFLQESLSMRYWLGVIFMLIGILLIATEIKSA